MHDLISDLATSVAGEFYWLSDENMDMNSRNEALEMVRHLSFICERYGANKKLNVLQKGRRLRTVLAMSPTSLRVPSSHLPDQFYISDKVLIELLLQLQFLRVLSLAYYNITEVPNIIGNLQHMRYLNFSCTKITCLPEQIGDFHNLQSLLLSGCYRLSSLPNSIGKLINLRHLDIADTPELNKMPLGLGGLTGLQTLSRVIIGGPGEYRISELKGMLHLRGQLSIEGLHEVKDAVHAKQANLLLKKGIYDLKMEWSDGFDDTRDEKAEYEVLDGLRPFEKLTSLEIVYNGGAKYPSWVGDSSFVCLTQLTLRGCRSCTCLATLGHLPSLQELIVESMDGLKTLGLELVGPSNSWHGVRLESYNCPNNIEKLHINYCPSLTSLTFPTSDDLPSTLKSLSIGKCDNVEVRWLQNNFLSSLESLSIWGMPKLRLFPEGCLVHLTRLRIWDCDNIESIPDNGYGFLRFLMKNCKISHLWKKCR